MKTISMRVVALTGALAIVLSAAACSKSDAPTNGSTSPTTSSSTSAGSTGAATSAPDAPEPSAILQKAKDNALGATSGAFVGQIDQDGKTIKIDFKGTSDGKTADIAIESEGDGKAHMISLPDAIYIQGDETFWKRQNAPAKVQKAGDKYIKAPTSASALAESLSLKSFLEKAFGAVTPDQLAPEVASEIVNGIDCWVLSDKKGKQEGALYISKDKSEVVRFTGSTSSPGQLDFSKWNEDLGITAPDPSQVMQIS
jgi:hypothetical protein